MGWTGCRATHYKRGKIDKKAAMDHEFGKNPDWGTIVKSAVVGSTYYAAIHSTKYDVVWGLVCLVRTKNNIEICYKDMDETMEPYYYDCPKGVLDALTPLDDPRFDYLGKESKEMAQKWRDDCKANRELKKTEITMHRGKTYIGISKCLQEFMSGLHISQGDECRIVTYRNSWYVKHPRYSSHFAFKKKYWQIVKEED